jgi:hypothetical protein
MPASSLRCIRAARTSIYSPCTNHAHTSSSSSLATNDDPLSRLATDTDVDDATVSALALRAWSEHVRALARGTRLLTACAACMHADARRCVCARRAYVRTFLARHPPLDVDGAGVHALVERIADEVGSLCDADTSLDALREFIGHLLAAAYAERQWRAHCEGTTFSI